MRDQTDRRVRAMKLVDELIILAQAEERARLIIRTRGENATTADRGAYAEYVAARQEVQSRVIDALTEGMS